MAALACSGIEGWGSLLHQKTGRGTMPNSERAVLRAVHGQCDLDLLEPCGFTVTIERDAELCQPGAVADSCWRVVSGCLRRFELLDDGRRHVNAFLLPGDFFGFDDPEKRLFGVEAVTTTTLRCYPRKAVDAAAENNPAIARQLAALTVANLHLAYQRMVLLGRKTSAERLASFVLEMAHRLGKVGAAAVDLPMGREDIADYLGLTKETVCRVLTEMMRSGVVRLNRNGVEILLRQELVARSGGVAAERAKQIASRVWSPREARRAAA